jgi:hypothetical protein
MSSMTRRQLLLGAAGVGIGVSGFGVHRGLVSMRQEDVLEALFWSVSWRPEMAKLGRLYIDGHPEEKDVALLRSLVLPDPGLFGSEVSVAGAREAFAAQVQQDFERGDLVELNRWSFSRSEGRFAALFWLMDAA